jgi:hypothetical protein
MLNVVSQGWLQSEFLGDTVKVCKRLKSKDFEGMKGGVIITTDRWRLSSWAVLFCLHGGQSFFMPKVS